ncbi:MAG TPA: tetratricopeptide repeat protein [Bryobacteraceae bacterium]|nr:tetratricopeptide repeat protein [Bryobacteraceae bacterium]
MTTCGLLMIVLAISAQAQGPTGFTEFHSFLQRGRDLQESGRHQDSQRLFEKALRIVERIDPASEAVALAWLGSAYSELRRWSEGERTLVRCLELRNKLWGSANERDPNHARILISLGGVEVVMRRYKQAEERFDLALRIRKSVPGGNQGGEFAANLNNLAIMYSAQGNYSVAARYLREALAVWQDSVPADDRRLAKARYNLAGVLSHLGLHAEADKLSSEALTGFNSKLDQEPLVAAELLSTRSSVLRKAKRGREAKALEALARDFLRKAEVHQRVDVSALGSPRPD